MYVPSAVICQLDRADLKHRHNLVDVLHIEPEIAGWNKSDIIEVIGRRARDVDMAGAEVYRGAIAFEDSRGRRDEHLPRKRKRKRTATRHGGAMFRWVWHDTQWHLY